MRAKQLMTTAEAADSTKGGKGLLAEKGGQLAWDETKSSNTG